MGDTGNIAASSQSNNWQAGASGISSLASLVGGYAQSQAMKAKADFEAQQMNTNARLAEMNAKEAIAKGDSDAEKKRAEVRGVLGSQRASYASQGIDIGSGSAMTVQEDTAIQGAVDVETIKNNAYREAWGLKYQAGEARTEAQFRQISGRNEAAQTLLTGGLQALSYGADAMSKYSPSKKSSAKPKTTAGRSNKDYSNFA